MDRLLNCPFCGREVDILVDGDRRFAGCPVHTQILPLAAWNTRHDHRKPEECKWFDKIQSCSVCHL
jgi:hypothetical protein